MKINSKQLIALSLILGFTASVVPASAFMRLVRGSEGMGQASVSELAGKDVAILPGNPFHGALSLLSGIQGWFVASGIDEAMFELDLASRRAGEVRKLMDWAGDNRELLSLALRKYQEALADFNEKLSQLRTADFNDETTAQLSDLIHRILTQLRFVEDARTVFVDTDDTAVIDAIYRKLVDALRTVSLQLNDESVFSAYITQVITEESDAAAAVRIAHVLAQLVREASGIEEDDSFVVAIADARQAVVEDLATAIAGEGLPLRGKIAGSAVLLNVAASDDDTVPVSEIVDQLADETLKAEIYAIVP